MLPLLRERSVYALDLAVLPGAVGPGVPVLDARRLQPVVEQRRAVSTAVVGHHALGLDAELAVEVAGLLLLSDIGSPRLARASHLLAVWRLTPIWRAVSATSAPDPMRETSVSRPLGVSLALGCCDMGGHPSL